MPPDHLAVLKFLKAHTSEEACYPFAPICRATRLNRKRVRLACRALARKGWAEFYRGLCTNDGDFAGSGYCVTAAGREALALYHNSGLRRIAA